jgi:hypothetical protein
MTRKERIVVTVKMRCPAYHAMTGVVGGGYVGVSELDGGPEMVGVAIPCGAVEVERGDRLALFSLIVDAQIVPGLWTCRGGRFVPAEALASPPADSLRPGQRRPARVISA